MEGEEFLESAGVMSKFIVDYLENIRDRRVLPTVKPGYLRPLLPDEAPETSETFDDVMKDIERVIMPGVTHWHSPRFNAYFPTACSYPAILADMLSGAIACIGFSWISSPACTELEMVMMDWLAKLIGLPEHFLFTSKTNGGGVIQGTASEATLVTMLSAKKKMLNKFTDPSEADEKMHKLIAYTSAQSHSSVERAAMLAGVKIRLVSADEKYCLRGDKLREAIEKDLQEGLIPFYVAATLGTTSSCAFDSLREIAEVANEFAIWSHVDAAYAGASFLCEEFRYLMDGIELVDSFNFNPHKWMLVNFDCSALWVINSHDLVDAFNVDPLYLKHNNQGEVPDYRHWQIPLGRRFRSLKLWFVMRLYGKQGLQKHIREHVDLAKEFEKLVRKDNHFEIIGEVVLGLVCFRLKAPNEINEALLQRINAAGIIHMVPSKINEIYFLRYAVCSRYTQFSDVQISWDEIQKQTNEVLKQKQENKEK